MVGTKVFHVKQILLIDFFVEYLWTAVKRHFTTQMIAGIKIMSCSEI